MSTQFETALETLVDGLADDFWEWFLDKVEVQNFTCRLGYVKCPADIRKRFDETAKNGFSDKEAMEYNADRVAEAQMYVIRELFDKLTNTGCGVPDSQWNIVAE